MTPILIILSTAEPSSREISEKVVAYLGDYIYG